MKDAGTAIRSAVPADLDTLVRLEDACFQGDRISRRSFRHLLAHGHMSCLIAEVEGQAAGYALVLYRGTTSLARLYSIAVDPAMRGHGLARLLLKAAEDAARAEGCAVMRLEVRQDNAGAIALYRAEGYREFAVYQHYYEDLADALRMQKALVERPALLNIGVPFYAQTLEFTCGAACLMMAMQALDRDRPVFDRTLEIRLWREATTIYMTSGHGGCGPHGLALAARRRGYAAEIHVSDGGPLFLNSVRAEKKKEVLRLVHQEMVAECIEAGVPITVKAVDVDELCRRYAEGEMVLVLTSQWRIHGEKVPHWVIISGVDGERIYAHDPDVDDADGATSGDCMSVPILRREFARVARYGRDRLQAAVFIRKVGQEPSSGA